MVKYGGMKQTVFDKPFQNLLEQSDEEAQELLDWLIEFNEKEYKRLHEIFRKPLDNSSNGPELWDRYFLTGRHHLIEMRMLKEQAVVCREKWKTIPKNKKKGQNNNAEENNEDSDNEVVTREQV